MNDFEKLISTALDNITNITPEHVTGLFYVLLTDDGKLTYLTARDPKNYYIMLASAQVTIRRLEAIIMQIESEHGMYSDEEGLPN
jgi:hypothetical protein